MSHSGKLLVVDDSEMNRDLMARRLERKGFTVYVAESAHRLQERILELGVELVLLDVEMPEISGLDALKVLRQSHSPTELPIIMVTAKSESEDVVEALELGANDYVTKPVDFPVALARIKTQLSHKRAEQALRESEERYALAAQGANDGLWDWNLVTNTVYYSPRWKSMLGYRPNEIGDSPSEWFERIHDADKNHVKRRIEDHQNGIVPHFECETRMRHKDGTFRWMLSRGVMVREKGGRPLRMAGSQTDITEGKVADPMTGLPNRLLFIDRLLRLMEHRKRRNDTPFAVLFLDLDGFKMINDTMGHVIGDKLLVAVANRLVSCLRSSDTIARMEQPYMVARLGGDEFAILVDHLTNSSDATSVAERLVCELTKPFKLDDKEIFTSVSIGIAISNSAYTQAEELLRDADTAMYRAKSLGKRRYEVFDAEMRAAILSRLELETDLRYGIERSEFYNCYQPIVSLDSGRITGFEALLRWSHPTRGLVSPDEFIPVAEETGMIRELGWWNLREACRQIRAWKLRFDHCSDLTINVNLSSKQFLQPDLVEKIQDLLERMNLPPATLKLELTESSVMSDPASAVAMLNELKALGICIAIDDFGTGYSSLSYLHRFPLDTLKIDRSFVRAMSNGGDGIQIVKTIMPLAANLGLNVVAEGVETAEQVALLRELNCGYAQGFFFSEPLTVEKVERLLQSNTDLMAEASILQLA